MGRHKSRIRAQHERAGQESISMKLAVCFTNFGPYHLARLRALAVRLRARGSGLIAYEVAGSEQRYPWCRSRSDEPFDWNTLFPHHTLETIPHSDCRLAIRGALDRDRPDAVGMVGYVRPESMVAARWARRRGLPSILMSESQQIDRPHVWWKELVKKTRLGWFDAALVGGPPHRDYLVQLGMPSRRIALGYNAVDNGYFAAAAGFWRKAEEGRSGLPPAPYFLAVSRFVPEKNLVRLIKAYAAYRARRNEQTAWDLVVCGDGPELSRLKQAIAASVAGPAIHCPGFLQSDALARWYAHAGAFVLPSLSEPWGLVVNEAAASGLPLLVSARAGCASTLVPGPRGTTGAQFDPLDINAMADQLTWISSLDGELRRAMGFRAAKTVSDWGPDRFAQGALEALEFAQAIDRPRGRRRTLSVNGS
jgi:1,2-diacylglycerol 3-alpha-glucosyltransferase